MVVEKVLFGLVNTFIGELFEHQDRSQVQISVGVFSGSGEVVLKNLQLKEKALETFGLPILVRFGKLEQLMMKVPWKNIYTEPTIVKIDGLYMIAAPSTSVVHQDEEKDKENEQKAEWAAKQKELSALEETKRKAELAKQAQKETFAETFIAHLIKNLDIRLSNVHLRYEDNLYHPQSPFACGVTLKEFNILTTDENWNPMVIKETVSTMFKIVNLQGLSVYWDCVSRTYVGESYEMTRGRLLADIVVSGDESDLQYIIQPISSTAQVQLCSHPESTNYSTPKVMVTATIIELNITLDKCQYQNMIETLETMMLAAAGAPYRRYRPNLPKKNHGKAWWKFAYKCTVLSIQRRHLEWSWKHMKHHRVVCRKYKDAYRKKLLQKSTREDLKYLEDLERNLNVFNIRLAREQAEVEVTRMKVAKQEKRVHDAAAHGWFGNFLSNVKEKLGDAWSEGDDMGETTTLQLSAKEKEAMYQAMNYDETALSDQPKTFVATEIHFKLNSFKLELRGNSRKQKGQQPDEQKKLERIVRVQFDNIACNLFIRPTSTSIDTEVKSLMVTGLPPEFSLDPIIMVSSPSSARKLLLVRLEINPLDSIYSTQMFVTGNSLIVVFDANTLKATADFFKPPEDMDFISVQEAAIAKLEEVKQQTTLSVLYALETHKLSEIQIQGEPIQVIVPQSGPITKKSNMLVLGLGNVGMSTEVQLRTNVQLKPGQIYDQEELKQKAYDQYNFLIKSVELFLHPIGDVNFTKLQKLFSGDRHVLLPTEIHVDIQKCFIQDPLLPKLRIIGKLSLVSLSLSDVLLMEILEVVDSIDMSSDVSVTLVQKKKVNILMHMKKQHNNMISTLRSIKENERKTGEIIPRKDKIANFNSIQLEINYNIAKIMVNFRERRGFKDEHVLRFAMERLQFFMQTKTFENSIKLKLGCIYLQQFKFAVSKEIMSWYSMYSAHGGMGVKSSFQPINLIETSLLDRQKSFLLTVEVKMVSKNAEFETVYENTFSKLNVRLGSLEIVLHSEAIVYLIQLFTAIKLPKKPKTVKHGAAFPVPETKKPQSSVWMESAQKMKSSGLFKVAAHNVKSMDPSNQPIDILLNASVDNISIAFATKDRIMSDLLILGIDASIKKQKSLLYLTTSLKNLSIKNRIEHCIYKESLYLAPMYSDVLRVSIIMDSKPTDLPTQLMSTSANLTVHLKTGCLTIVYFNRFVKDLMIFLKPLSSLQSNSFQPVKESKSKTVANENTLLTALMSQTSFRIILDIDIRAPAIIFPLTLLSNDAIVLDLGSIHVTNNLQKLDVKSPTKMPAIIDTIKIEFSRLQLSKAVWNESKKVSETLILLPLKLEMDVVRNLSGSWYHNQPFFDISCNFHDILVEMSHCDFVMILTVLDFDFNDEIQVEPSANKGLADIADRVNENVSLSANPGVKLARASVNQHNEEKRSEAPYSCVKFNFLLNSIHIQLFSGVFDPKLVIRGEADSVANFQLTRFEAKFDMKSDNAMNARVILHSISLKDTRVGSSARVSKGSVIRIRVPKGTFPGKFNMLDFRVVTDIKPLKTQVSLIMKGLVVIISMNFINSLSVIFTTDLPRKRVQISRAPLEKQLTVPAIETTAQYREPGEYGEIEVYFTLNKPEFVVVDDPLKETPIALVIVMNMMQDILELEIEKGVRLRLVYNRSHEKIVELLRVQNFDALKRRIEFQIDLLLNATPLEQKINGGLHGLSVVTCVYSTNMFNTSLYQIIGPLDIMLHSKTEESCRYHKMIVEMSDVVINISMVSLGMLSVIFGSFSVPKQDDDAISVDVNWIPRDVWVVRRIQDYNFWFLRPVKIQLVTIKENKNIGKFRQSMGIQKMKTTFYQLTIKRCCVFLKIFGIISQRVVPYLIAQVAIKNIDARDWMTKFNASCQLIVEVAYFNHNLGTWEPIIEPVFAADDRMRCWEMNVEVYTNDATLVETEPNAKKLARTNIHCLSHDTFEITVTKTMLEIMGKLSEFATPEFDVFRIPPILILSSDYVVKNDFGKDVILKLGKRYQVVNSSFNKSNEILLKSGQTIELNGGNVHDHASVFGAEIPTHHEIVSNQTKIIQILLEDGGKKFKRDLSINRAEKRSFNFVSREPEMMWNMVVQIDAYEGSKVLSIHTEVELINNLQIDVELHYKVASTPVPLGIIKRGAAYILPFDVVYTYPNELIFKPVVPNIVLSHKGYDWKRHADSESTIECESSEAGKASVFISVKTEVENIFTEMTSDLSSSFYSIHLNSVVIFRNLLPFQVTCQLKKSDRKVIVLSGNQLDLVYACPKLSILTVEFDYYGSSWKGAHIIRQTNENMAIWTFKSSRETLDLGIYYDVSNGTTEMSLFSQFWLVNLTEQDLTYRGSLTDELIPVVHKATFKDAFLFMMKIPGSKTSTKTEQVTNSKEIRSRMYSMADPLYEESQKDVFNRFEIKRTNLKLNLKIGDSKWSNKLHLDVVGSAGVTSCEVTGDKKPRIVGVKIYLSSSGLTRIVRFKPYFTVTNQAAFNITFSEFVKRPVWHVVPSGKCIPFWPEYSTKMVAGVSEEVFSKPFSFKTTHTTLLKLDFKYNGIRVHCVVSASSVDIVFQHYQDGMAPVLLVNDSKLKIEHQQRGQKSDLDVLEPGYVKLYTWFNPMGVRIFIWSANNSTKMRNKLDRDGSGECGFFSGKLYWTSFLNGNQRVLLFTHEYSLVVSSHMAASLEPTTIEVIVALKGIGISLVNNSENQELAYFGITPSSIVWEERKKKGHKALKKKLSTLLEDGYQSYLLDPDSKIGVQLLATNVHADYSSDPPRLYQMKSFNRMKEMVVRRNFRPAIWVQLRQSAHQTEFCLKVNHVQLDNHVPGSLFTTVVAPVAPRESVTLNNTHKVFVEMSAVMRKSEMSDVIQLNYLKLLIQEFAVKVDLDLPSALLTMLTLNKSADDSQRLAAFKGDHLRVEETLKSEAIQSSGADVTIYCGYFHLSPIKIRLSFSLSGADKLLTSPTSSIVWNSLDKFIETVGAMSSNIDDVELRLGYFERKNIVCKKGHLVHDIITHYIHQGINQTGFILFGSKIIGNPVGAARGMATGVTSLFYEPYQGAVQGPEEFAAGLGSGVTNLARHAVGESAGIISRITGALGEGISTIILTKEEKRSRKISMHVTATKTIGTRSIRAGRRLALDFWDGISGIVMRPIKGAKAGGAQGFVIGAGSGLANAVVRPVGGILNFSARIFESLQRGLGVTQDIDWVRPTRVMYADGIVRPYNRRDAEGYSIFMDLNVDDFIFDAFLGHLMCKRGQVLLFTDMNIILAKRRSLTGNWTIVWTRELAGRLSLPVATNKGLHFRAEAGGSLEETVILVLEKERPYIELLLDKVRKEMTPVDNDMSTVNKEMTDVKKEMTSDDEEETEPDKGDEEDKRDEEIQEET